MKQLTESNKKKLNLNKHSGAEIDKDKISGLQAKLLDEFKYNYDTFEKTKNIKVSYNQAFQLLHVDSCKFLACHNDESKHESDNFIVTLDEYASEATLFKFSPAFKYQKDGDQVIFTNEIFRIERAVSFHNKPTYLHCSSELDMALKQTMNQSQLMLAANANATNNPNNANFDLSQRHI